MCLSVAVHRPNDVLASGHHAGFEWSVVHNGMGYRCGYVKVEPGHPWFGKGYNDIECEVHGGLTFAAADVDRGKGGPDDGWWVGFDCAHAGDAADPALPGSHRGWPRFRIDLGESVRTQEYVEAECRSLCEQARAAMIAAETAAT
jgi:hypothetical protein